MSMTKTIRVSEKSWSDLKNMCTDLEQQSNSNKEVTISASIALLLSEYTWRRSEEYKKQKETTLKNQYIPKYQHEAILEELKIEYENEKRKFPQDKSQNSIKNQDLNIQLKEQIDIHTELQKTISNRDTEISELKKSNTGLAQQANDLTQQIHDKEIEYNKYVKGTTAFINHAYIDKEHLRRLYPISCFLFRHKKNWYSVEQLDKIFWRTPINEIPECLSLLSFPIIPIIRGNASDGTPLFCYNNRYLHNTSYKQLL